MLFGTLVYSSKFSLTHRLLMYNRILKSTSAFCIEERFYQTIKLQSPSILPIENPKKKLFQLPFHEHNPPRSQCIPGPRISHLLIIILSALFIKLTNHPDPLVQSLSSENPSRHLKKEQLRDLLRMNF